MDTEVAKEKHLAVVEVGAVVKLAKGLTSSHLIEPMRMMLILSIFFVKYSWILFWEMRYDTFQ